MEVDEQSEAMKVRELSQGVVEHFTMMAKFLANYRSGKMPATFNVCYFFIIVFCIKCY